MSGVIGVLGFSGAGLGGNASGVMLDAQERRLVKDSRRPIPGTANRDGDAFSSSALAVSKDVPALVKGNLS